MRKSLYLFFPRSGHSSEWSMTLMRARRVLAKDEVRRKIGPLVRPSLQQLHRVKITRCDTPNVLWDKAANRRSKSNLEISEKRGSCTCLELHLTSDESIEGEALLAKTHLHTSRNIEQRRDFCDESSDRIRHEIPELPRRVCITKSYYHRLPAT